MVSIVESHGMLIMELWEPGSFSFSVLEQYHVSKNTAPNVLAKDFAAWHQKENWPSKQISLRKSNWIWSRTGHSESPELSVFLWPVGDFSLVCCYFSKSKRKVAYLLMNKLHLCCWTAGVKTNMLLSLELQSKRRKWLSQWGGPCLQILSRGRWLLPAQRFVFKTCRKARFSRFPSPTMNVYALGAGLSECCAKTPDRC